MNTSVVLALLVLSATATQTQARNPPIGINNNFAFIFFFLFNFCIPEDCNCNLDGCETKGCDANGQCHCKCAIQGLKCTECIDFHYGFPNCEENCKFENEICSKHERNFLNQLLYADCGCNREGSTSLICNKTDGQCACKPNVHGRQCDKCKDGFKLHPNCTRKSTPLMVFRFFLANM